MLTKCKMEGSVITLKMGVSIYIREGLIPVALLKGSIQNGWLCHCVWLDKLTVSIGILIVELVRKVGRRWLKNLLLNFELL